MKENNLKVLYWMVGLFVGALLIYSIAYLVKNKSTENSSSFPPQYIDSRTAFTNSIKDFQDASDLTNKASSNKSVNDTTGQVISLITDGIGNSKKVEDAFLDYLDPNLKFHYREQLIKGEQEYLDGLKESSSNDNILSDSTVKQVEGNGLYSKWIDYWQFNSTALANKAFAK